MEQLRSSQIKVRPQKISADGWRMLRDVDSGWLWWMHTASEKCRKNIRSSREGVCKLTAIETKFGKFGGCQSPHCSSLDLTLEHFRLPDSGPEPTNLEESSWWGTRKASNLCVLWLYLHNYDKLYTSGHHIYMCTSDVHPFHSFTFPRQGNPSACHWTSLKTWEAAVLHLIVICDGRSLGNPEGMIDAILSSLGCATWVISHVPIEHHPTIRYMVYNGYYKVMSNIPKMGHLPTPVRCEVCDFRK